MPRIDVVLPVRNAVATLPAALESLRAQTFRDFRVLCVDDASADNTRAVLEETAAHDPRFVMLQGSGGLVRALQQAVARSDAPLLARMDADDVSHPERFAKQLALLDARPDAGVASCLVEIPGAAGGFARYMTWLNSLTEPEAIDRERFIESPVVHPTVLMRRDAYDASGGYQDPPWAEDYDLWLRMLACGVRIAKVPEVLFTWHDRAARLTRTDGRYSRDRFLACRAHYIARLSAVRERGVMISAAGPTGKTLARHLLAEGTRVHAFIDVHPRRTGATAAGIPVRGVDAIPPPGGNAPVQLAAAGRPAARERIRALMRGKGYTEGADFWCAS